MNTSIQTQSSAPLFINGIHINAELDTSGYSGLSGLLNNAPLLALSQQHGQHLNAREASYLQSCIEPTINTLGDTLKALAKIHGHCKNAHEFLPAHLLNEFTATVACLLPHLHSLSNDIQASKQPQD